MYWHRYAIDVTYTVNIELLPQPFCFQTAKTQYQNSKQIFPEIELRGLSPNFHIHVSDLYIPMIGTAAGKFVDRSWEYINCSQTHECGNSQFLFWEHIDGIFVAVHG
jgi:hypothetical protein